MPSPGDRPAWRVLLFPGATEIAMEVRQALAWRKEVELFSAGADVSNHAPFVFSRHTVVPSVSERFWAVHLKRLIVKHRITHVFPAHDDALLALAERAASLPAKVITSPLLTCRLTRSKSATLRRLRGIVPVPKLYGHPEEVDDFPVFLKPDAAQGSQRTSMAANREQMLNQLAADSDRLILEYLPGAEYTVDCFSDREQGLLYASGRARRRIRSGIAMDTVAVRDPRFEAYARLINEHIELHGAWFFQVKAAADGTLKLMEIAPRIGGASGLSRVRGVNLPLLSLYEAERCPVVVTPASYSVEMDRAMVTRYRHDIQVGTIYIDLDDTLIVRGRVNPEMVKIIFQARNRQCRICLITRHAGDLAATLFHHRLSGLFDEVIHLRAGESKAAQLKGPNAVLIDDSHKERQAAMTISGCVALDSSAAELLTDDRV